MKRFLPVYILWIFFFILSPTQLVKAQHGDLPPLPEDAWKGQVSGKVVNQTTGVIVKEAVDVMLHAWDTEEQERLMVHGKTELDGTFRFEGVDFHQTFSYSVMTTYQGATYFSPAANLQKGETSITFEAEVYDTTKDQSSISVDQLHVLFYVEEGQLGVTQFYGLSNSGNRTVKDAVTLPSGRAGALKFYLPDEAEHVQFGNDSSGERYVLLAGGFLDTAPVPPGEGTGQVIVGYYLPYDGKLDYDYVAPAVVNSVIFLVQEDSGITLQGDGLTPSGERTLQDGAKFNVFTASSLEPGETLQVTLSGRAKDMVAKNAIPNLNRNTGLGIGAGVLGLSLLVAGIWWWRRQKEVDDQGISEDTVEGILSEIQSLDQTYAHGELSDKEYQEDRADLVDRLKAVVKLPTQ